jgi:hypothetical protein
MMKKAAFVCLLCTAIFFAILARAEDKTFSGEIMDSQCASLGGHQSMMSADRNTPKSCTLACVKLGGMFVLYDATAKKTYQLDDQKKPEQFAGEKVTITGSYNESTQTIHVINIEAAK